MKHGIWMTCGFLFLAAGGAALGQTVLLDDVFTEASRSAAANQPTSVPWLDSASSSLTLSSGALKQTGSGIIVGYVTPQTLATGDSLTLSFTFTAAGITSLTDGFRVGLFSAGTATVTDNFAGAGTTFDTYQGYGVYDDLGLTGSTEAQVFRRVAATAASTGTQQNLMGGGYPTLIGSTGPGANLNSGTSYTGTLTITNNGTTDTISYSLGGTTFSTTDTTHYTSFDTIALQLGANATSVSFSEIKLTYAAAPEPSTLGLALAAGVVVLAGGGLARRRRLVLP